MKRHILYRWLIWMGMLLLVACRQDDCTQTEGTAQLRFQMKATGSSLQTRGVEDLNDDGTVSEAEAIVDGRRMYRLSVFLLDGTRVVSSTVLEADDERFSNDNTEAIVSFDNLDYTKTYKLYAVANYGTYNGLTGKLSEVTAGNMTVSASNDKLCNKNTPYPLTLAKDISLSPGVNNVGGELVRTYARIRINVRNQSATNDLTVTKLSFPTKFTQSSVDIFNEGGTADAQPVVTSPDAITPFAANMVIPMLDDESNVSEKTIFDSYLLESTGGDYKYTLGVKYESGTNEVYTVSDTRINQHGSIENGALYVIYHKDTKTYLYANGDKVSVGNSFSIDGKLDHNYVWKLNSLGNNKYTIESMGSSGKFIQSSQTNSNAIPLTVNASDSDYFTVNTSGNNNNNRTINFKSTAATRYGYSYYVAVTNAVVVGSTSPHGFYLYKVNATSETTNISSEKEIPISIIDKNTGEASSLTAIKRNDFINILVNVTYNEKTGEVEFEVSDWDNVNGDVTFD